MAEPELDEPSPAPPPWLYDAEQIEQKYEEAVAAAGEACAEDTEGHTHRAEQPCEHLPQARTAR